MVETRCGSRLTRFVFRHPILNDAGQRRFGRLRRRASPSVRRAGYRAGLGFAVPMMVCACAAIICYIASLLAWPDTKGQEMVADLQLLRRPTETIERDRLVLWVCSFKSCGELTPGPARSRRTAPATSGRMGAHWP